MNRFILVALSLLLCCCHQKHHNSKEIKGPPTPQESARDVLRDRYAKISNSAESLTARELKIKYGLGLVASGWNHDERGYIDHLSFVTHKKFTLEQARQLLVYTTESYLYNMSQYDTVAKNMWGYSYDFNNVNISVSYDDSSIYALPYVSYGRVSNGEVKYYINKDDHNWDVIYREPYEEAYKIVYGKDRRGNVPQKKQIIMKDSDINIILEKKCNRLVYNVQRDVIKELKKEDKVWIQDIDAGLDLQNKRFFWVFLWAKKEFNEEEGKKLFVDIVELCLDKFRQKDEAFKEIPFGYFGIKNMYIQINNKYIEGHPTILGSVSIKDGIVKCVFHENGGPYNFKEQPYEEVYREIYGKERAQE